MSINKLSVNLIPDIDNPTPDYYCTWQTQLYTSCDGKPPKQRQEIRESSLFGSEKPYGWAYFYPDARRDLFIVMDDSWDIPLNGDGDYLGSLILNSERFPEATEDAETNAVALKNLTDRIKSLGWKGLGGWVCCQESKAILNDMTEEEYWKVRLKDANEAGFSYWKVDWGEKWWQEDFRKMLTDMGHRFAPNLVIEHAMIKGIIPHSDTFRTYDVPGIMSIPMTMHKLSELAKTKKTEDGYMGLINCEDEVYIGAAGGYAFGVMRHPNAGNFTDGRPDPSFPALHRNIKTKITELTRAARWHRIAPAFSVNGSETIIDEAIFTDSWTVVNQPEEIEAWWGIKDGDVIYKGGPERISRSMPLPEVAPDSNGLKPYVVSAKNPCGAVSVATLGRTIDREWILPECDITIDGGDATVFGVFGVYKTLKINSKLDLSGCKILMQDLKGDFAYDVTDDVTIADGILEIPGNLIYEIGTSENCENDTSEPGVIIKIER